MFVVVKFFPVLKNGCQTQEECSMGYVLGLSPHPSVSAKCFAGTASVLLSLSNIYANLTLFFLHSCYASDKLQYRVAVL